MPKRKKYSPEYKREAIELARRSGASCQQVALEIGVAPNLATRWVREAHSQAEKRPFLKWWQCDPGTWPHEVR